MPGPSGPTRGARMFQLVGLLALLLSAWASVVLHAGPARAQPGGVTGEVTMRADQLQQVGCIVARQQRSELAASGVNEVFLHDSGVSQNHGWAADRTSSRRAGRWCASP